MTSVIVLGDLNVDIVVAASGPLRVGSDVDADIVMRHGGSAANMAAWLAHEEVSVTFVGSVGNDSLGRDAVAALQRDGVDTHVHVAEVVPTGTCVVLVDPSGERTMLPDPGANRVLPVADLPLDQIAEAEVLLVSGYALLRPGPRAAACAAVAHAHAHGVRVLVDAASSGPIRDTGASRFLDWIGPAWIVANEPEVTALASDLPGADVEDALTAARLLSEPDRTIVVKRGSHGAALVRAGTVVAEVPAAPAEVLDSTGAGDAFAAGLVAALVSGADEADALRRGVTLGALAVSRRGGRPTA